MFQYNYYQDCYDTISSESAGRPRGIKARANKRRTKRDTHYTNSLDINSNTAVGYCIITLMCVCR